MHSGELPTEPPMNCGCTARGCVRSHTWLAQGKAVERLCWLRAGMCAFAQQGIARKKRARGRRPAGNHKPDVDITQSLIGVSTGFMHKARHSTWGQNQREGGWGRITLSTRLSQGGLCGALTFILYPFQMNTMDSGFGEGTSHPAPRNVPATDVPECLI